jgi:nucleoside-diphosphate-sugar epimerase
VDEEFLVNPSFPYAISKVAAERSLLRLADRHFRPIILRKGTVVGWSPRMRFDLVTNTMVATALQERRIVVHNPGLWRPILDVVDAGRAYLCALAADLSVSGIFNIAGQNYTISCLAEEVAAALAEFGLDVPLEILHRPDVRSYRVSTTKAKRVLGFSPAVTMGETVRGIMRGIIANGIRDLADPRYYNVERLRQLIQGQEGWGHLWQRPAEGLFPIQRG